MTEKSSSSKAGFLETPIKNPCGDGNLTAFISLSKAQSLQKFGPAFKYYELLTLVRETLADPHAIHAYNGQEFAGFCYARTPSYACRKDGSRVPPPDGMVFVVFVTDSMKVGDWGWEPHHRDDPLRPQVCEGRLEDVVWSRNQ